jgi:hypothetical protein
MGWQPIETAPRAICLVYDAKKGIIPEAMPYGGGDKRATYGYYNNVAYDVTHWWDFGDGQTMPPPPTGDT